MSEYIVRVPDDMPYDLKAELNAWYIESEPIVRCEDCKFFDTRKCKSQWPFRFNGFCAWGERTEEGR